MKESKLSEANRFLQESQKFAHIGSYVYDLQTGFWDPSPELCRMFGIEDNYVKDFNGWLNIVAEKDRERLLKYFSDLIDSDRDFDNKYMIKKISTGETLWVHGLGEFETDSLGKRIRMIGTIQDITEKNRYEEQLQESISILKTTLESTADGILAVGKNGTISFYNKQFVEMWEVPQDILDSKNDNELVRFARHKTKNPMQFESCIQEINFNPDSRSFDEVELADGKSFERYSIPQYLNGEIVGRVWSFRDITQRKLSELKLKEREEHFRSVVEFSQDAFYRRNLVTECYDYVSPVFKKLTGYSVDEILRMNKQQILGKIHHEELQEVMKYYYATNFEDNKSVTLEYRFLCKDGNYKWFADKFIFVKDENEDYIYGSIYDISERKRYEAQILFSSYHDSLTGLYNRRYLDEMLPKIDAAENLPISIIVGDVNGLKLANDTFGHNVGDMVLMKCADIISSTSRPDDIIARWGGDEFIVIMLRTDFEEANSIVRIINEKCSNVMIKSVPVSISLGFETKKKIGEDINVVLKIAEDYMYKHKIVETSSMRGKTIEMMLNTLYEKNKREEEHSRRTSEICALIGTAMKLPENIISKLKAIGLVHDIGKIALNEELLNKPERLGAIEWSEIKRHSEIGFRILNSKAEMSEVAKHVLMHHERLDGSGYPKGLKGDQIPLISRIVALADSYDAMTSERPYRAAMSEKEAIEEITAKAGILFDYDVSKIFVEKVLNSFWTR